MYNPRFFQFGIKSIHIGHMDVAAGIFRKNPVVTFGNMQFYLIPADYRIMVIHPALLVKSEFLLIKSDRFSHIEGKEDRNGTL